MKLKLDSLLAVIQYVNPFPLDEQQLGVHLEQHGFTSPSDGKRVAAAGPDGRQAYGFRWTRSDTLVAYLPDPGVVLIEGNSPTEVSESIDWIREFSICTDGAARSSIVFCEISLEGRIKGKKGPLDSIAAASKTRIANSLSDLFGMQLKPLEIRLFSSNEQDQSQPIGKWKDWVDVVVAPFAPNPELYAIRIVIRNCDVKTVSESARTMVERAEATISLIEV